MEHKRVIPSELFQFNDLEGCGFPIKVNMLKLSNIKLRRKMDRD